MGIKVLIIEDEEKILSLIEDFLQYRFGAKHEN